MQVSNRACSGGLREHHRQRGRRVDDIGGLDAIDGLRDPVAVAIVLVGGGAFAGGDGGEPQSGIVDIGAAAVVEQIPVGVVLVDELGAITYAAGVRVDALALVRAVVDEARWGDGSLAPFVEAQQVPRAVVGVGPRIAFAGGGGRVPLRAGGAHAGQVVIGVVPAILVRLRVGQGADAPALGQQEVQAASV